MGYYSDLLAARSHPISDSEVGKIGTDDPELSSSLPGFNVVADREDKVVLVRGIQAKHLRRNPKASHLKAEFVLQGFLGDDDLHIFTTGNNEDVDNVAKVVREAGGDFSKAVVLTADQK